MGLAPNCDLLGADETERALVDQWIHANDTEITGNLAVIVTLLSGLYPYSKPVSFMFVFHQLFHFAQSSEITVAYRLQRKTPPCHSRRQ